MNRRWLAAAALLLAIFAATPNPARACSCLPAPPRAVIFAEADLVFRGRILHATNADDLWVDVGFEVSQVWKGPVDVLKSLRTPNNSAACGIQFQVGQDYVVYVQDAAMGHVYLCDRVRLAAQAAEDLAALGAGRAPAPASLPEVIRHARVAGTWYNPARNGEGFVVEVLEDGRGVVYWFGYRPDDALAQGWLTGVGQFVGQRLTVDSVAQPRGGGFGNSYDPSAVQLIPWGSLTMDFPADGSARARWTSTLPGYGSGEVILQRLTRSPQVRPAP